MLVRRRFDFVAFWDECAWVAGVTEYNNVAQGQTLHRAVENLKHQLFLDATLAVEEGRKPFEITFDGLRVMKEFSSTKGTVTANPQKMDPFKDVRYRGTVEVKWESDPQKASGVPWYLQD